MTNYPEIKLYNTFSRSLETFKSIEPGKVKLYCCGPTVYDYQHIGNFKTFMVEDLLVRALRYAGYEVKHVMNITDVGHLVSDSDAGEDKMLVAARREKKKSIEIAEFYTKIFFEDWDKLGLKRPDIVCKATDHIQDMIELTKKLEEKGYAYFSNGNVYFDVAKFKDYGKMALLDLDKLQAGKSVTVDPHKHGPFDFVLWFTKSKFENHELLWDSPWGPGYPGWHIECSAMSMKHLGEQFDIHWGGIDHIPVHHTNEIAQSEAALGHKWVNYWMHSEFILINNEKMAKSKGNFMKLSDLVSQGYSPEAYRFLVLGTHYRKQINFSKDSLDNAMRNLSRIKSLLLEIKKSAAEPAKTLSAPAKELQQAFAQALYNDLNTPLAMASLWEALQSEKLPAAEKLALVLDFDRVLGLQFANWKEDSVEAPDAVKALISQREAARKEKNFAESDRLRDEIAKLGFAVKDGSGGQTLSKI